jgi:GDP-L-fucose synthase
MKLKKIFIAGQEGMVGSSIYNLLKSKNLKVIKCKRKDLNLTSQNQVNNWFKKNKPEIVINAAGKVGGILDNSLYQTDYIYINTTIGFNLLHASLNYKVKKFINLGSACVYPKFSKQPIKEEYLLSSRLEKSNEAYAIAKIAVLKYTQYIKLFLKKDFISLQPANLYGEGDNFDLKSSHVIPALIRKFHEAKIKNKKLVEIWGSGAPKREFMHVKDLAEAVYFCLRKKISQSYLNVGSNQHISIKQVAKIIQNMTQYKGKIFFNKKYPEGVKYRKLDSTLINSLGWKSKISFEEGIKNYYSYFKKLNFK